MQCLVCGKAIQFTNQIVKKSGGKKIAKPDPNFLAQTPYCPDSLDCRQKWLNRRSDLFTVDPKSVSSLNIVGSGAITTALRLGAGNWLDDKDFAALSLVSKDVRSHALPHQLQHANQATKHFDKQNPAGVDILAEQMLEIAMLAYQGALEVKAQGKPIILYRVTDKGALNPEEKSRTLSGRIRVKIRDGGGQDKEVWPLEKTAAWIQGALRAKASFLLLSDPRGDLLGGTDRRSDAVYVRELHQILSSFYVIDEATSSEITARMKTDTKRAFILRPKQGTATEPIPLIPRMWRHMALTKAWDGSISSLTIGDSAGLIRDHLQERFNEAARKLNDLPLYS